MVGENKGCRNIYFPTACARPKGAITAPNIGVESVSNGHRKGVLDMEYVSTGHRVAPRALTIGQHDIEEDANQTCLSPFRYREPRHN